MTAQVDNPADLAKDIGRLIPDDEYRPTALQAFYRLLALDPQQHDLVKSLFSKDDLQWMQTQLNT